MPLRGDREGLSLLWQVIVLAVAIVVLSAAFYILYVKVPPPPVSPRVAETGDTVDINYIGSFEDTGRVFDTSYESVAVDNVSYPKAVSFGKPAWRGQFSPFQFQVGCVDLTPEQQQATRCTAAIRGFDRAVRGLSVGDTKRVVVPPEDGYGDLDPTKVFELPLLQGVTARETMNETAFAERFGIAPSDRLIVLDPFWRWNVTVSLAGNIVTITHSPKIGQVVRPYSAWDAAVESIDDSANGGAGIVYVRHLLDADDAGSVYAVDEGQAFIVSSVDTDREVYVANYNSEVTGRTLVFEIALVSIIRR